MAKRQKVPVSVRAAIQRINRKLKPDMEQLKVTRGGECRGSISATTTSSTSTATGLPISTSTEKLGRELGVLAPWETMVDDD